MGSGPGLRRPPGAPARASATRQLAENGRCGEGRRARWAAAGRLELGAGRAAAPSAAQGWPRGLPLAARAPPPGRPRPRAPRVSAGRGPRVSARAPQAGERPRLHWRVPVSGPRVAVASALEGCVWGSKHIGTGIRGCVRGSARPGGPVLVGGSLGPRASGPLSVSAHPRGWVCCVACGRALSALDGVRVSLGDWAACPVSPWDGAVRLCGCVVGPGGSDVPGRPYGVSPCV